MSEELKPCPFCGGKARMHVAFASGGDHSVGVYVECLECRSWSGTKWGDGAQEKAADAWNRRAERTCRNLLPEQYDGETFKCSECGYVCEVAIPEEPEHYSWLADWSCDIPSYCPNCGAKVVER